MAALSMMDLAEEDELTSVARDIYAMLGMAESNMLGGEDEFDAKSACCWAKNVTLSRSVSRVGPVVGSRLKTTAEELARRLSGRWGNEIC